ncbi:MAG: hypothetical protein AABY81_08100 [Pseudomonadota bacterium]
MKSTFLVVALAALTLAACGEGKKSLDGYPMDKPPPSADAPRDSEPNFDVLKDEESTPAPTGTATTDK